MLNHKDSRRIIASLMTACILSTSLGISALAADTPNTTTMDSTTQKPTGTAPGAGGGRSIFALSSQSTSEYFTDLTSNTAWANAYIDFVCENSLVSGTAEGIYSPNATLKRGDFALMLYRKYSYATEGFSYGDVSTDAYYYQAVMRGKASEVFEDTKYFYPQEAVTREQAAVWIYNSELNNGMPSNMASTDLSMYKDSAEISQDAAAAVAALTAMGIFAGDDEDNFNPADYLTRAQVAVLLYRLSFFGGNNGGGAPDVAASVAVEHGSYAALADSDVSTATYTSTNDSENALRIEGSITVALDGITVSKTAGAAGSGDTSNFYGVNAGVLALDGADVTITDSTVTTTATGSNGIFSYGEGTTVTISNTTIRTTENSSGGIMVTGGGTMYVNDSDIETQGDSSAALRTDRGGGTLVVNGGSYVSNGKGSPAIYSTADVAVSNATLTATSSESLVVEGKNAITLTDCTVYGDMIKENVENLHNVMIYQSMSGDADNGLGRFTMTGGSLESANGDMFYVTNTAAVINLRDVELIPYNDILLTVVGNDARNGWGVVGSNGGTCTFIADTQEMTGKIIVDEISSLELKLTNSSAFSGTINSENEGGTVDIIIDSDSTWTLTGDAYITTLTGSTDNIDSNGYTLYVNGTAVN